MGKQDHFPAAYGNLNVINFGDERVEVEPVIQQGKLNELQNNLMLLYFSTRDAGKVLESQIERQITSLMFY